MGPTGRELAAPSTSIRLFHEPAANRTTLYKRACCPPLPAGTSTPASSTCRWCCRATLPMPPTLEWHRFVRASRLLWTRACSSQRACGCLAGRLAGPCRLWLAPACVPAGLPPFVARRPLRPRAACRVACLPRRVRPLARCPPLRSSRHSLAPQRSRQCRTRPGCQPHFLPRRIQLLWVGDRGQPAAGWQPQVRCLAARERGRQRVCMGGA